MSSIGGVPLPRRERAGHGSSPHAVEQLRWLGIQGRHLATLVTVADEGTFARAAERLGYTQSTISHQVATLEKLVGERLVDRGPGAGTVTLTRAGEVLLEHANAIMARLGAARADLAAVSVGGPARLRLGVFRGIGLAILPRVLAGLAREQPDVHVELVEGDGRRRLHELVIEGELEIAFALGPATTPSLGFVELARQSFVLLLPPGWSTRRADWRTATLVAPAPCPAQALTEEALGARGHRPRDVVRVDDLAVIEELVACGSAVGLVPRSPDGHGRFGVLDLDGTGSPRTVIACWHNERALDPVSRRAIELAEAAVRSPGGRSSKPSALVA